MFDLVNTLRRLLHLYTPFEYSRRSVKRSAPLDVDDPDYILSSKMRRLSKPCSDEWYSSTSSDNSKKATAKRFNQNYPTITLDDDDEDIVEIRDAIARKKPFTSTPGYNGVQRNGSSSAYFDNSAGTSGTQNRPVTNGMSTLETATNFLRRTRDAFARARNSSSSKPSVIDLTFRLDEKARYKELLEKSSPNVTSYHSTNDTLSKYHTPVGKYFSAEGFRSRQMVDACKLRPKVVDSIDLTEGLSRRNKPRKSTSTAEAVIKVLDDFDSDAIVVKDSDSDVEILPTPPSPKPDFKVERVNSLKSVVDSCEFSDRKWLEEQNEKLRQNRESNIEKTQELEKCTRQLNIINREIEQKCLEELVRDSLTIKDCYIIPEFERNADAPLPELTPEQEDMVYKAWNAPTNYKFYEAFRLELLGKHIRTLDKTTWLEDTIINLYMNLIIERGKDQQFPKAYAFNTFFYPKLIKEGYNTSLARWTKRIDLFSYDIIAVPVHLQVHWCMAIIDLRDKSIKYYDSMGGANNKCLEALRNYLLCEHKNKKHSDYDMNDWQLESCKDIPQQWNGSDCGVFACTFAEFLTRNAKLTFGQEDMPYFRKKITYELLTKKLMIS